VATAIPRPLLFSWLCEPPWRLGVSCSPSATVHALHRPLLGHIKRSRERIRFHIARKYLPSIRDADMSSHPMFLSRSMTVRDLIRACDPYSDEVAQAFLRSEVCYLFLPAFALIEGWCRGWNGLWTIPSKIPRLNSRTSMVFPGQKRLNSLKSTLALHL